MFILGSQKLLLSFLLFACDLSLFPFHGFAFETFSLKSFLRLSSLFDLAFFFLLFDGNAVSLLFGFGSLKLSFLVVEDFLLGKDSFFFRMSTSSFFLSSFALILFILTFPSLDLFLDLRKSSFLLSL